MSVNIAKKGEIRNGNNSRTGSNGSIKVKRRSRRRKVRSKGFVK